MLHQCTFAQNRPKSVFMSFDPMLILHIQCQFIKGSLPKTKRENVGIFPKSGTPSLPPVWEFFPDFTVYFWEVSHVKNSNKKMGVGFG